MRPVQTADSTLVLTGGGDPNVGDLHAQRLQDGSIASVWWLSAGEREAIAGGANIALIVAPPAHPPVWLAVVDVAGVGEDAPDVLERLEQLRQAGAS